MTEPVSIFAAITSALTATVSILLFFDVDPKLVGAISIALTAWVGVAAAVVRSKTTPTAHVALTNDDVDLLNAAKKEN